MRLGHFVLTLAALASFSTSLAVKLPVKTIEVLGNGEIREILSQVGTGMSKGGGGTLVRRAITKVPLKIPWGGVLSIAPAIVLGALNAFYNAAQNASSGHPSLDSWWNPSFPVPGTDSLGHHARRYEAMTQGRCTGYDSGGNPFTAYVGRASDYYGQYYKPAFIANTVYQQGYVAGLGGEMSLADAQAAVAAYCAGATQAPSLGDLMRSNPQVADFVTGQVTNYITNNPDLGTVRQMFVEPTPTINQYEGELIQPLIISTIGSSYPDGDYLQEGIPGQPGNVRAPSLEGGPLEPWPNSPEPLDTDEDNVPDYRDGDDDNDGISDEEEIAEGSNPKDKLSKPLDTDGDGIPDRLDTDDDNDGFPDSVEIADGSNPKDASSKPADTDGDGVIDSLDDDDDNDGFPDTVEILEGSNPKDKNDKPTDKPCAAGSVRDAAGSCVPEPKPPEKCSAGYVLGADGKTCEPKKEADKCPEGKKLDGSTPPKCVSDDDDDKGPVSDDCGDFSIRRLMTHTGGYLRDVVFPCEKDYDWIDELRQAASTKFPFSLTSKLDNIVEFSGSSTDQGAALPSKLGPFDFDWSWLAPLITVVGLLFKGFITWAAVDIILSRLAGQVVIK